MTYSIIKKSQLESAMRLDAEYYQPEYLDASSKITSINHIQLKNYVEKIFSGPFGSTLKSESYLESGIPFIRIADISGLFIQKDSLVFISQEEHKRIHSTYLNSGDIILSKIGTVGRLSVIPDEFSEVNISENNIGIRLSKLSREEKTGLLFFLLSKYGQQQLIRKASGNIQLKLNVDDVESILMPVFSKEFLKKLNDIYSKFLNKNSESQSFYLKAENLLLEELGLKDFSEKAGLWNIINLSETKKVNRIDADYFQPKYQKMMFLIRANSGITLAEIATLKKGFEPGSDAYQEEGKLFIRVSSLSKYGITDKDQKYLKEELYEKLKKDYQPKIGEILLTKDASPGISYVVKEPIEGLISGGVLRIKLKEDIEPEYLGLVINSIVGQLQVERDAGGSIIMHWRPDQIKEMQIPILSKDIQQKIANLVQKSHESHKKAKELLEEAKHKVEELIENNNV